ncbi:DUF4331 domain-containing protein, partial [Myxococcota bacterium]|nr:DUF4331 domain-containing protein [Myxococcota bacterium]
RSPDRTAAAAHAYRRSRTGNRPDTASQSLERARPARAEETEMHPTARAAAIASLVSLVASHAFAASHREAPLMALDPAADISDVYAFVSYSDENLRRVPADRMVTLIMNVVPAQEPSSGPNYFAFGDDVRYQLVVDNDRDGLGLDDVIYDIRFETEVTKPDQFLYPVAVPPVTELEGAGASALAAIQRYRVTELRGCRKTSSGLRGCQRTPLFDGAMRPTVPSNIGPRTTPDYAVLAAKGVFTDTETGIRVFAGQRAETFAIDLGAVFDTVNLRVENGVSIPGLRPPLPVQTAAEDADDRANPFGVNAFSGFNVQTIAIEVPIRRLTRDRGPASAENGRIGVFARTLRKKEDGRSKDSRPDAGRMGRIVNGRDVWVQVSRMANPLVNELIIRFGRKDLWNATLPEDESFFVGAYRDLDVAGALELVSGVEVPEPPRNDIVDLLLQYPSPQKGTLSELLRLDLSVPPTPVAGIRRLGIFAHDASGGATPDLAGFPNGRRPDDDVTDIVVRAAGGANYVAGYVGDGVGVSALGIASDFPFLPTPSDGRGRRHVDPGE